MRSAVATGMLLLAAVLGVGCDTTQPLQVGQQTFSVFFSGPGATVESIDTYRLFEDSDGDSLPDPDTPVSLWCERPTPITAGVSFSPTSLPWSFTYTASILPAGSAVRQEIVSQGPGGRNGNVGQFDTNVPLSPRPPNVVPSIGSSVYTRLVCDGDNLTPCTLATEDVDCAAFAPNTTCNRTVYKWDTSRYRSAANPLVVEAAVAGNQLNTPSGCLAPTLDMQENCGECPRLVPAGFDYPLGGEIPVPFPQIVGEPQPYDVVIDKGDTVIVESIWVDTAMPYIPSWYGQTGMVIFTQPAISASANLNGLPLTGELLVGSLSQEP